MGLSSGSLIFVFCIILKVCNADIIFYTCNFEQGRLCPQLSTQSNVWKVNQYATPEDGTGPSQGADGSIWYIYFDSTNAQSGSLVYTQDTTLPSTTIVLSFKLHAYGANCVKFNVLFKDTSSAVINVSNPIVLYNQFQTSYASPYTLYTFNMTSSFQKIEFLAISNGVQANYAIDDISLTAVTTCSSFCHPNATCLNRSCVCNSGFTGDGFNNCTATCPIGCNSNATCVGTTCICKNGFIGDGVSNCTATCASACNPNATCVGTTCVCNNGFIGDGVVNCTATCASACNPNATCVGTTCVCNNGFIGDGVVNCTATCASACNPNATCVGTTCVCKNGFIGDGVNNCIATCSSTCNPNATCIGTTCVCNSGYFGDGINSCTVPAICSSCHPNATCNGTACVCKNGYNGDGINSCIGTCSTGGFASCSNILLYNCDFEKGVICSQLSSTNGAWKVNSFGTPLDGTGPSGAANGLWYIYFDSVIYPNGGTLVYTQINSLLSNSFILSFNLHAFGVNCIQFEIKFKNVNGVVISASNAFVVYNQTQMSLFASYTPYNLQFNLLSPFQTIEFIATSNGQHANYAIDDIVLKAVPPCLLSCNSNATCNGTTCVCNPGFIGDGVNSCTATCAAACNSNAICVGTTCVCKNGFIDDGVNDCTVTCLSICNPNARCIGTTCVCNDGFVGDGINNCTEVDGGFSDWSDFSPCTKTCGGGVQTRTRECDNPKPQTGGKDCIGIKMETQGCNNSFCPGPDGVTQAQNLVHDFLNIFYVAVNLGKPISGKSLKAIFEIQKAVAAEFVSVDPTAQKPIETLLKQLEEFLITAAKGGSIDFARVTLGKSLFNFMKKKITEGLPIDDINEASEGYLNKIKSKVGDEKFSQIISSQGASTLMFVIDTTGSMSEEINAAKGIAKAIIETTREFPVDYILSPFNDPGLGPVVYKSEMQRAEVIDEITKLSVYGGGDCPELAFGGMLNAFNKGPQFSSPMFVFTDASAKDDSRSNIDALKGVASSYSSPITFFANLNGCGSGIDSFKEIAAYTSGQIFPLKDDTEIMSFTEYVKSSLQQDTVIASAETSTGISTKSEAITSYDFFVDDGIEKISVFASTSALNAVNLIQLQFEDGTLASPSTTTSMTKIYQLTSSSKGFFGKWTLNLSTSAVDFKYSVQAVSNDPIEFSISFAYQQHPTNNSPVYLFSDPIKGLENNMLVRVAGRNINLSTFKCQVQGLIGTLLSDLSLFMQENGVFSVKITPPNSPFKLKCYGLTINGSNFERISLGVLKPKTTFMVPIFAGNMFTALLSNTVDVQVMVFNFDNVESITFTVKASHGSISPAVQTLTIRENAFIQFEFHAPSESSLVGTTVLIAVSAQRVVSKEEFSSTFSVLIV
ncbi:uncharacterized protein LOC136082288 [Hydra vulgaris]|uniref:Uncharacterized protein LOC136082288 n=1 Tax=Hydra vulgaris TaxID=6087 RepID=A0ABM4C666_HYDVU